jgi:hypothetical protein
MTEADKNGGPAPPATVPTAPYPAGVNDLA